MRIVSEIGNIISSVTFLILLLPLMKNQFHIYLFSIFLDFFFLTNALLRFCVCFALLRLAYQHFTYFSERKTSKIVIKYTLWGGGGGGQKVRLTGLPTMRSFPYSGKNWCCSCSYEKAQVTFSTFSRRIWKIFAWGACFVFFLLKYTLKNIFGW